MGKTNDITIDQSGHILISKTMRVHLGVVPGTMFVAEEGEDHSLSLRPLPEESSLIDEGGVLVVQSQAIAELTGVERREREARIADLIEKTGL